MLRELYIENVAVIEKTSVLLEMGFNVFTGETGAGKSIIIDAINAVLGARTSKDIVRHGAPKATVIARFDNVLLPDAEDGEVILTREITCDGKSYAKINGKPIAASNLREISLSLINIHGQHDSQILLSPEKHIDILDKYGEIDLTEYLSAYKEVVLIKREIKKITEDLNSKEMRIKELSFAIEEIDNLNLKQGEEEKLIEIKSKIKNQMQIQKVVNSCYNLLKGDGGAVELTSVCGKEIENLTDIIPKAQGFSSKLIDISYQLEEICDDITSSANLENFNGNSIDTIENRLYEISKLKHKYSDNIIEYKNKASKELDTLTYSDKYLKELNLKGSECFKQLLTLADQITLKRKEAAKRFIDTVSEELKFLDMPNVSLEVNIENVKPNIKGKDNIEFLISVNKGEPPKSIAKIASGGELSRIMLAIKNTLADKDEIQTLIFDEIDTGVSGKAAQKIGLKLRQASKNRQIIVVTHSAQIAALGDSQYLIKKESTNDKTFTNINKLDENGRINEIARIIGTDKITDLTIKTATEMLNNRKGSE
ncbi:MAG: DNA repair protein RecN [Oscillospiraceae bacterium]